ncbi:unnamed protein product [Timema podura]|uniref:Uncharacterized protein n=1 Tax=Timema podura TaxID=61482 RepID=A0ABN7PNB0_TIMPD|nr:unnamed protein product [Timema podura]
MYALQVHGGGIVPEVAPPAGVPTARDDVSSSSLLSAGDSEDQAGRIRKDLEDSSLIRSSKPYSYSYTQPTILYVPPSYQPGQYYYVVPDTTEHKTSYSKDEEKPLKVLDLSLATPTEYLHKTLVIKKPTLPTYHNPLLPLCKKIVALEESKKPETPQEHVYNYPNYPNYPKY